MYYILKVIDFPKCIEENEKLRGIFRVVSRFPLHFSLYLGNIDYLLDSVLYCVDESLPGLLDEELPDEVLGQLGGVGEELLVEGEVHGHDVLVCLLLRVPEEGRGTGQPTTTT